MNDVSEMVRVQEREHGIHCRDKRAMAITITITITIKMKEEALGDAVEGAR